MSCGELNADLKFDDKGLIPAIIQDHVTGQVLMMAYMNDEAYRKTIETGRTWFWSRSRSKLWNKGETSGHFQIVKQIIADCDRDCLLVRVEQVGESACHEGDRSCFHNPVTGEDRSEPPADIIDELYQVIRRRQSEPVEGSYTSYLFSKGLDKILKKLGEESAEVIIASKNDESPPSSTIYEMADLIYHLLVLMAEKGITPSELRSELASRRK